MPERMRHLVFGGPLGTVHVRRAACGSWSLAAPFRHSGILGRVIRDNEPLVVPERHPIFVQRCAHALPNSHMKLPLDTFEQVIDEKILDRGLKYFQSGAVDELEELEPGYYEAKVQGSEEYTVRLRVKGEVVTEHTCDCPYDLGAVCKHVVAVIFFMKQENLDLPKSKKKDTKRAKGTTVADKVGIVLKALSSEELQRFIREQCVRDSDFRQVFLNAHAQLTNDGTHASYLKQVKGIIDRGSDRYGYIDWRAANGVADDLDKLNDQAKRYVQEGALEAALPIATAMLEGTAAVMEQADDSDGGISGNTDEAVALLAEIAAASPPEALRKQLLAYCMDKVGRKTFDGYDWHDDLLCIAAQLAKDEREGAPVLHLLHHASEAEYSGSGPRNAALELTRRLRGEEEAALLETSYLKHTDVREAAIAKALARKDFALARTLAVDGQKLNKAGRQVHQHFWTEHLLRIAQAEKDTGEVLRLARILVVGGHRGGLDEFKLLKKHTVPNEWPEFIEALLTDIRASKDWQKTSLLAGILANEERWAELLELVKQETHWHGLQDEYEKPLGKIFPLEMAAMLGKRADLSARKDPPKRNDYVEAVQLLRRMNKMGEHPQAEALAATWRQKLPRRRGLMEELAKL